LAVIEKTKAKFHKLKMFPNTSGGFNCLAFLNPCIAIEHVSSVSHSQWRHTHHQLHSKTRLSRQYLSPIRLYNLHFKLAHHSQYLPQSAFVRTFSRGPGRGGAGGAAGEDGEFGELGESAGGRRDGEDGEFNEFASQN
jgi:hypothetical protein